jgi:hypothetical protein
VLGGKYFKVDPEPPWRELERVPALTFLQGLRKRNWTNNAYDPTAPKWTIQMWRDSGRFVQPSFSGFRAFVEEEGGRTFWVDLDSAGLPTFLETRLAGAGFGTPWA